MHRPLLIEFWTMHPQSEIRLATWYRNARKYTWKSHAELKADVPSADYVGNGRYVFNIGQEYRIVAVVNFTRQAILLKWVGLHKDYDRIDATTI